MWTSRFARVLNGAYRRFTTGSRLWCKTGSRGYQGHFPCTRALPSLSLLRLTVGHRLLNFCLLPLLRRQQWLCLAMRARSTPCLEPRALVRRHPQVLGARLRGDGPILHRSGSRGQRSCPKPRRKLKYQYPYNEHEPRNRRQGRSVTHSGRREYCPVSPFSHQHRRLQILIQDHHTTQVGRIPR
jgi:hypothetical protein